MQRWWHLQGQGQLPSLLLLPLLLQATPLPAGGPGGEVSEETLHPTLGPLLYILGRRN